jgi:hypothetical protein
MRTGLVAVLCLVLAGCTDADWSQTMTRLGMEGGPSNGTPSSWFGPRAEPAPDPGGRPLPMAVASHAAIADGPVLMPAAQATPDNFCDASARQDADRNAFDALTREHLYQTRLVQCRALMAR